MKDFLSRVIAGLRRVVPPTLRLLGRAATHLYQALVWFYETVIVEAFHRSRFAVERWVRQHAPLVLGVVVLGLLVATNTLDATLQAIAPWLSTLIVFWLMYWVSKKALTSIFGGNKKRGRR